MEGEEKRRSKMRRIRRKKRNNSRKQPINKFNIKITRFLKENIYSNVCL